MSEVMSLSESQVDYVTTIWQLVRERKTARATEISRTMGVKRPSVSNALKMLAEKQLVNYTPYGHITLTEKGELLARSIERRKEILCTFLTRVLAINPLLAEENAKRMEYAIAPVVLNRLTRFIEYYDQCPGEKVRWVDEAVNFLGDELPQCVSCAQTE